MNSTVALSLQTTAIKQSWSYCGTTD